MAHRFRPAWDDADNWLGPKRPLTATGTPRDFPSWPGVEELQIQRPEIRLQSNPTPHPDGARIELEEVRTTNQANRHLTEESRYGQLDSRDHLALLKEVVARCRPDPEETARVGRCDCRLELLMQSGVSSRELLCRKLRYD